MGIALRVRGLSWGLVFIGLLLTLGTARSEAGTLDAAKQAAQAAASTHASCTSLVASSTATTSSFYWEIGDRSGALTSGTRNGTLNLNPLTASTAVPLYSAGKWLYASYVLEKRGSQPLSPADIRALTMHAGYTDQGQCALVTITSVAACQNTMNTLDASAVDKFSYGPGHFQKHAVAEMNLGSHNSEQLAAEIIDGLGGGFALSYNAPQLAGGARGTGKDYAVFLRRLLNGQLLMSQALGSHAVCTDTTDPGCPALSSPSTNDAVNIGEPWHYALGHWVEDVPGIGDGAFSSPGATGFYPWVDADLQYYGVLVRNVLATSSSGDAAKCGRQIRKAFLDTLGPENGVCGPAASAPPTGSYPSSGLCISGAAQTDDAIGEDGGFNWKCKGYRGGTTMSCSVSSLPVIGGTCGTAANTPTSQAPIEALCASGIPPASVTQNANTFSWTCAGIHGGGNASCSAPRLLPVNGSCGAAADAVGSASYPTTALCASGTPIDADRQGENGTFDWLCSGQHGGANAPCSVAVRMDGRCGAANNVATGSYPVSAFCDAGQVQNTDTVASDGSFNWNCAGTGGGNLASCSAPRRIDASCGAANGSSTSSFPAAGLCASGNAQNLDTVASDGSFNWNCNGSNGGGSSACAAPKQSNGSCGTAANVVTLNYPGQNLCAQGTATPVDQNGSDGAFNWTCPGSNGGSATACSAPKQPPLNGQCGSAHGMTASSAPSSNLCAVGSAGYLDGAATDGDFNWQCSGQFGGSNTLCSAPRPREDGACGGAAGKTASSMPMSGLCASGRTVTNDTAGNDGTYNWQCLGVAGGGNQSCSAPRATVPAPVPPADATPSSAGGAFGSRELLILLTLAIGALRRRRFTSGRANS